MTPETIKTLEYLNIDEIAKHLQNVEYIIMAAPAPEHFKKTPLHFTIFLNTSENLSEEIQEAVFNKFLEENKIVKPAEVMRRVMPVGFSKGTQETLMPLLIVKPEDRKQIPHVPMFVMDFLADSNNFNEAKEKNLTGWSYSYN